MRFLIRAILALLIAFAGLPPAMSQSVPASANDSTITSRLEQAQSLFIGLTNAYDLNGPTNTFIQALSGTWIRLAVVPSLDENGTFFSKKGDRICATNTISLNPPETRLASLKGIEYHGQGEAIPVELRWSGRGLFYLISDLAGTAASLLGDKWKDPTPEARSLDRSVGRLATAAFFLVPLNRDLMLASDESGQDLRLWVRCPMCTPG